MAVVAAVFSGFAATVVFLCALLFGDASLTQASQLYALIGFGGFAALQVLAMLTGRIRAISVNSNHAAAHAETTDRAARFAS